MTPSDSTHPELTPAVLDLIRATFPPAEHSIVTGLVRSFHWVPAPAVDERIHLDLLEMSAGSLDRLRQLLASAQRDWRDIILAAEFDVIGEQIIQNERGKRRLAELAARKHKSKP